MGSLTIGSCVAKREQRCELSTKPEPCYRSELGDDGGLGRARAVPRRAAVAARWMVSPIVRLWILLIVHQPCRTPSLDAYDGIRCEHPPGVVLRTSSETAHGVLASTHANKRGRSRSANEWPRYVCRSHEQGNEVTQTTACRLYIVGSQRDFYAHGSRSVV
jgi:hypothetical protein